MIEVLHCCAIVLGGAGPCEDAGNDGILWEGPATDDGLLNANPLGALTCDEVGVFFAGSNWCRDETGRTCGIWVDAMFVGAENGIDVGVEKWVDVGVENGIDVGVECGNDVGLKTGTEVGFECVNGIVNWTVNGIDVRLVNEKWWTFRSRHHQNVKTCGQLLFGLVLSSWLPFWFPPWLLFRKNLKINLCCLAATLFKLLITPEWCRWIWSGSGYGILAGFNSFRNLISFFDRLVNGSFAIGLINDLTTADYTAYDRFSASRGKGWWIGVKMCRLILVTGLSYNSSLFVQCCLLLICFLLCTMQSWGWFRRSAL